MFARAQQLISLARTRQSLLLRPVMRPTMPLIQMRSTRAFSSQTGMNENEIIEYVEGKVFEVLKQAAKCRHDKLSRTATFEELGFDSLDGVELVLAMEEYFGFDISNAEAEKITAVMDAIQIFHTHVVKRQSLATQESGAEQQ
jgi:acyl carrier protein